MELELLDTQGIFYKCYAQEIGRHHSSEEHVLKRSPPCTELTVHDRLMKGAIELLLRDE